LAFLLQQEVRSSRALLSNFVLTEMRQASELEAKPFETTVG